MEVMRALMIAAALLLTAAVARAGEGNEVQQIGRAAKKGAKKTGHAVREVTRETGHAFRDGAKTTGHAVRGATRETGHAFRRAFKGTGKVKGHGAKADGR
jgi:hypothetical protein